MTNSLWMKTTRIETLVDGIFAISMTLLILTLNVPNIPGSLTEAAFQQRLGVLWPQLLCYFLSFLTLSGLWRVNHQQFNFIKHTNSTMLNINIFFLILVALVPFSTEMVSSYGSSYFTANIIFQVNLLLVGILSYINWNYALWKGLVDVDDRTSKFIRDTSLILPICSIIAMSLSFYIYSWSSWLYFTIPAVKKVLERRYFPGHA